MATHRRGKSKNGQIRHQFIVGIKGQRPISKTFDRKAEGRAWAADMETKYRHGDINPKPESHDVTFHMVIEAYRRDVLAKNPTLAGFRGAQHQRWDRALDGVSINRVTPALVSKARREIERAHHLGPATSNQHLSALSALFEYAKSELFWIQVNPCSQIIRRKEPPGWIRYLSDAERVRLLRACRDSPSPILYDAQVRAHHGRSCRWGGSGFEPGFGLTVTGLPLLAMAWHSREKLTNTGAFRFWDTPTLAKQAPMPRCSRMP